MFPHPSTPTEHSNMITKSRKNYKNKARVWINQTYFFMSVWLTEAFVCVFLPRVTVLLQCNITGGGPCCHCNSLRLRPPLTPPTERRRRLGEGAGEGGARGWIAPAPLSTNLPTYWRIRRSQISDVSEVVNFRKPTRKPTNTRLGCHADKLHGFGCNVSSWCKHVNLDRTIIYQHTIIYKSKTSVEQRSRPYCDLLG